MKHADQQSVQIVGAGPAGMAAAIHLARNGHSVLIHDQHQQAGERFNGDFQGLQNWVWSRDTLAEFRSLGLETDFLSVPFHRMTAYVGKDQHRYDILTERPLFYLLERGKGARSFDSALQKQAESLGVRFNWGDRVEHAESDSVIDASGPRAADIIAKGVVFETDHPDACVGVIDDDLAPKGYAYLLIHEGKGTLATCMFEQFPFAADHFDRTLEWFQETLSIPITRPVEFGGYGNFDLRPRITQSDHILRAGEAAGFQDYLWGFGMHYAVLSGHLAAQSILRNASYESLCRKQILPQMRTSLVNRWLFSQFAPRFFPHVLARMSRSPRAASDFLHRHYQPAWWKSALYPWVSHTYKPRLIDKSCLHQDCDCIWCRRCRARAMEVAHCGA